MPSTLSFTYFTDQKGTLLSFKPEMKLNAQPATGAAGASNQTGKAAQANGAGTAPIVEFGDANVLSLTPGVQGGPTANPGTSPVLHPTGESDPRVVALHGSATAQRVNMDAIKADAKTIGTPQLRARVMIGIQGVDQQYCGNWRVVSSRHVIDVHGYKVDAKLRRDAGNAKSSTQNKSGSSTGAPTSTVGVAGNANNLTFSPFP
jgi:hypothetical protein